MEEPRRDRREIVLGVLGVLLVVGVVFAPTLGQGFLNYDDDVYVTENPLVRSGLSVEGVVRAFGTVHTYTWHPLTTLSHMADVELFGLDPGAHHRTNAILHAATAALLFWVLARATGNPGRSAFVAAAFAVHPLRVESVAWISERKDVLSGLFFVLTLGAHVRFSRRRDAGGRFPRREYALLLLAFAAGLLSKPTVVTAPFVLLLLDRWPLDRLGEPGAPLRHLRARLVEKLPLFLLAALVGAITLATQSEVMTSSATLGFGDRITNALYAYATYVRQLVWPFDLALVYPHPEGGLGPGVVAGSVLALTALSALAWTQRGKRPFLLVGWLWFLGMLVPVIGLVQVGIQSHADRYTYLAHVGLLIALAWGAASAWPRSLGRRGLAALAAVVVAGWGLRARDQIRLWESPETLWRHTLRCTGPNPIAHAQLGSLLLDAGRLDEAERHLRTAIEERPDHATPHYNLGNLLARRGDLEGAVREFRTAVRVRADYAKAWNNLGVALSRLGRREEALEALEKAVRIDPRYVEAHFNLAVGLAAAGRSKVAEEHYEAVLRLDPGHTRAHLALGDLRARGGDFRGAERVWRRGLELAQARGERELVATFRGRLAGLGR